MSFPMKSQQRISIFKNIPAWLLLGLCLFILSQCKNETLKPIDLKKDYFPLKLNSVVIYDVDSIAYDDFYTPSDPKHKTKYVFQLKDSAVSEIPETAGRKTFVFERYKSINNVDWVFQKVFTHTLAGLRGEEFVDNQRFVRFIFPPEKDKKWNGNTYNNIANAYTYLVGNQEYIFTDANISQTINSIPFDSTATIKEIDEFNLIQEDYVSKVYANHVGLVKMELKDLNKALTDDPQKGIARGDTLKGLIYYMQIKSYKFQ